MSPETILQMIKEDSETSKNRFEQAVIDDVIHIRARQGFSKEVGNYIDRWQVGNRWAVGSK